MSRVFYSLDVTNNAGVLLGTNTAGHALNTGAVGGTVRFSDSSDYLVLDTAPQTLLNKTIVSTTNNVYATSLQTNTGVPVNVAGATAPTSGQVLTATGATAANWQALQLPGITITSGSANSSGNSAVTLETWSTSDNTVYHISTLVAGRRTDTNTQGAGFGVLAAFRRASGAGSLVRIGYGIDDEVFNRDDNAWSCVSVANTTSGNISVVVTANTGANVAWRSSSQIQSI